MLSFFVRDLFAFVFNFVSRLSVARNLHFGRWSFDFDCSGCHFGVSPFDFRMHARKLYVSTILVIRRKGFELFL